MKATDDNKVSFEITFQVSFLKSTYMKYLIERSTNTEMSKWLENFALQLKKSVEEFRAGTLALTNDSTTEAPDSGASSSGKQAASAAPPAVVAVSTPSSTTAAIVVTSDKTSSSSRDYLLIVLLVVLIIMLCLDLLRWRSVDFQLREMSKKMSAMEALVNSLSSFHKKV